MSANIQRSPAIAIGVLFVAVALSWAVVQSREKDIAAAETAESRAPSHNRPRLVRDSAHQQSTTQLRTWAASMTNEELRQMVDRAWAGLPQEDKDPEVSIKTLLCALFREWGRRDPEAAFAALFALQNGRSENFAIDIIVQHIPAIPLHYAIWAGYGERDPAGAWKKLGEKRSNDGDIKLIFINDDSTEMYAVLDAIFEQLLSESTDLATQSATKVT